MNCVFVVFYSSQNANLDSVGTTDRDGCGVYDSRRFILGCDGGYLGWAEVVHRKLRIFMYFYLLNTCFSFCLINFLNLSDLISFIWVCFLF